MFSRFKIFQRRTKKGKHCLYPIQAIPSCLASAGYCRVASPTHFLICSNIHIVIRLLREEGQAFFKYLSNEEWCSALGREKEKERKGSLRIKAPCLWRLGNSGTAERKNAAHHHLVTPWPAGTKRLSGLYLKWRVSLAHVTHGCLVT